MVEQVKAIEYWERPKDLQLPRDYWVDPEPEVRGMLSADRIKYYADLVRMIDPFRVENLKPASYGLTLGHLYQREGKDKRLSTKDSILKIPPNSIVFVSMAEKLMLPHYIAARFNLSIDLIYQGLLLGTGPQVDPGFQGVLSCPLHNISDHEIRIPLGKHFATIDFLKTTGLGEQAAALLKAVKDEDELYAQVVGLIGKAGNPNVLFQQGKRWLRPIVDYPPGGRLVESSVGSLDRKITRFRSVGIGAILTFVAIAITLVLSTINAVRLNISVYEFGEEVTSAVANFQRDQEEVASAVAAVQRSQEEIVRSQEELGDRFRQTEESLREQAAENR